MSHIFTKKQLENDNNKISMIFLIWVLTAVAVWALWLKVGKITVYEISTSAVVIERISRIKG